MAQKCLQDPIERLRTPESTESRVLVIEDDVELMNIFVRTAKILDSEIQVDWAVDVESAIDRIRRRPYRLVLADYYLKGSKRGIAVRDSCTEFQPDAVFAMMSSMALEEMLRIVSNEDVRLLRKPFTTSECFEFLGAALD